MFFLGFAGAKSGRFCGKIVILPFRMHSQGFQYRKCSLRFRCWSRRSYAAFVSLGREVLIGHLRRDVADCSMLKLKLRLREGGCCGMFRSAMTDGDDYPPDVGPDVGFLTDGASAAGMSGCRWREICCCISAGAETGGLCVPVGGLGVGRMRWFADERLTDVVCRDSS